MPIADIGRNIKYQYSTGLIMLHYWETCYKFI